MNVYRFDSRTAEDWLAEANKFEKFATAARDPNLRANFERMAADAQKTAREMMAARDHR